MSISFSSLLHGLIARVAEIQAPSNQEASRLRASRSELLAEFWHMNRQYFQDVFVFFCGVSKTNRKVELVLMFKILRKEGRSGS